MFVSFIYLIKNCEFQKDKMAFIHGHDFFLSSAIGNDFLSCW